MKNSTKPEHAQNDTDENKKKKKPDRFQKFTEETTVHGLQEFYTKKGLIRILWILFFLLAVGFSAFQVYMTFDEYLKYPTAMAVEVDNVGMPKFPAFSICQEPSITLDELEKKNMTWLYPYIRQATVGANTRPKLTDWSPVWNEIDSGNYGSFANLTLAMAESLPSNLASAIPNTLPIFSEQVAKDRGICLVVNNWPTIMNTGEETELASVTLRLRPFRKMFISFGDEALTKRGWGQVDLRKPGAYSIYTKIVKQVLLSKPKSPCLEDDQLTDEMIGRTCALSCRNKVFDKCFQAVNWSGPICQQYAAANVDPRHAFYMRSCFNFMTGDLRTCMRPKILMCGRCPSRCRRTKVSIEYEKFSAKDGSSAAIHMYLLDPYQVETVREIPVYSMANFYSNVGGLLGLACGASLMSVLHAILYCVQICADGRHR